MLAGAEGTAAAAEELELVVGVLPPPGGPPYACAAARPKSREIARPIVNIIVEEKKRWRGSGYDKDKNRAS